MASASRDRSVRLWIPNIRGDSTEFRAHNATVRSVQFSPDGQQLVTGSDDKTIKLWTVHRHKFVCSISTHTNWVRCVRFSPDGRMLVSCADDKTIKLHDINSASTLHSFPELRSSSNYVAFHPSGTCIAAANTDNSVKIYDIRTRKLLQHYDAHSGPVHSISFHPSGHILETCSADGTLKLLDLMEGRVIYTLHGHQGAVTCCGFARDGEYFASGGKDQQVMVWKTNFKPVDLCGGLEETEEADHQTPHEVTVALSPDDSEDEERITTVQSRRDPETFQDSDTVGSNKASNGSGDEDIATSLQQVKGSLQHLIMQLDTLTQTVLVLEQRLSHAENKISELVNNQHNLR
ncbi:POC1 centriolar protein homolog A isoform X2 [Procambarus clarkii]